MNANDFKRIILTEIYNVLKPAGFRKKGAVFSREIEDVVLLVQLQSSSKSTKDLLVITVNLGIFSRTVAARVGNTHAPNIWEAHWGQRIGFFMPKPEDYWWEVHSETEALVCGSEIVDLFRSEQLRRLAEMPGKVFDAVDVDPDGVR